jgi:predicted permease
LWSAMHAPVAGVLRSSATNLTASRGRAFGGRVVLAAQIAICLVLLVSGGLLLRTLNNYAQENLGFTTAGLLVFDVTPQGQTESHVFYRTLMDHIRQIPGVESVSMVGNRPGSGWSNNNDLMLDGVEKDGVSLRSNDVGANFFHTMGVPVLEGRDFLESDTKDSPLVAIVNESLAKKFFPKGSAIGHHLGGKHPLDIVGVVKDSKYTSVSEESRPMAYYAQMQAPVIGTMSIEVRTRGDARNLIPQMRKTVAMSNPDIPLGNPMTHEAQFELSYQRQRMFAAMGSFFGVLAAVLVATGLYGTHSFRVSRRTSEIGVRMALGATRGQVLAMVMRESLWILLAGLIAGLPLTYFVAKPLKSMLYQMTTLDPVSYAAAMAALIVVALLSALLPARRAASIEPMEALRAE